MTTLTNNIFIPLSSKELKALTKLVPETVATDKATNICKTFTTADLWKIQRAKKSVRKRRFI